MKRILVIGGGAMGSAFTVPCLDNNNQVIEKYDYDFDTQEKVANYISNTSRDDLIKLNNSFVVDGEFMNMTVQIRGKDFRDTAFFSWDAY